MHLNTLLISLLSLLLSSSTLEYNSGFDTVLTNCTNEEVHTRLLEFQKGGIEKKTFDYDIEKVITYAKSFLGTEHKMGGVDKKGIDCSGLVFTTHSKFGVQLARSSQEQARFGVIIPTFKELQRGDLVFYYNSYKTSNFITHTGIYLGEGKFIHTSNSKGVITSDVNDKYYWGKRFLFGTRLHQ
jgi:cell wall-associated NlpC family hydrolase